MKKTIRFTYVYPFEFKALEHDLNEMAQKGWLIKQICGTYMIFEQAEHKTQIPHYSVGLIKGYHTTNLAKENEETQKCKEFMKEFEYHYVCGYGPFLIFEGNSSTPFHNDEIVSLEEVKEITKHYPKPLSDTPIILGIVVFFMIFGLLLFSELRLQFLSDWTLWLGSFLILLVCSCIYECRKPYLNFRKTHTLSYQQILSPKRTLILLLPLICLSIFSVIVNSYFLLALYLLSGVCTFMQWKFYQHETAIFFLRIAFISVLFFSNLSIPYAQAKPQEDMAKNLGISYTTYSFHKSPLAELEYYKLGEWTVITHYVIKDSFMNVYIQQMIEQELAALSSNAIVIRTSYSDIWVIEPTSELDIEKNIKKVFPGE